LGGRRIHEVHARDGRQMSAYSTREAVLAAGNNGDLYCFKGLGQISILAWIGKERARNKVR